MIGENDKILVQLRGRAGDFLQRSASVRKIGVNMVYTFDIFRGQRKRIEFLMVKKSRKNNYQKNKAKKIQAESNDFFARYFWPFHDIGYKSEYGSL